MALKIARITKEGFPVYDCTVFAGSNSHICGDIHITGDFICGDAVVVEGSIYTDGMTCIGNDCNLQCIHSGEASFIGDNADALDIVSPEDIVVGNHAILCDVSTYRNFNAGDQLQAEDIEAWTGDIEIGPNELTGKIQVGR